LEWIALKLTLDERDLFSHSRFGKDIDLHSGAAYSSFALPAQERQEFRDKSLEIVSTLIVRPLCGDNKERSVGLKMCSHSIDLRRRLV
jgi:hypothetical protein